VLFIILPIKAPAVLFNQKQQELLCCQNFSRFNSFENTKKLFLLLFDSIAKSELNFKHSDYFIYHYGNSINYGYFCRREDIIRPQGEPPCPVRVDSL